MNTMTANIQREWLARIIDGSKTVEYRDSTDYWYNRLDRVGAPPFDLRLINGMRPDSPEATVRVDNVDLDLFTGQLRFHIAKVLSTTRWEPSWHAKYPPLPADPPFDPATVNPQQLPPAAVTIQAPPDLLSRLRLPGTHRFDLPIEPEQCEQLNAQGPDPFRLRFSTDSSSCEVVAYEMFYEPFEFTVGFSVITPRI